jgi:hypothetical protein
MDYVLLHPSTQRNFLSSKIVVDATRQFPAEGGPKVWPADNRAALQEMAPEAFADIDAQLDNILGVWPGPRSGPGTD